MALKILENIEISKQRIAQLQQNQVIKSEHQKFIDEQRKIVKENLQIELDRMFKRYEDFAPRAAYEKYLINKVPEKYHELHWELFDYLQQKIQIARDYRDELLRNGGSHYEARQVFVELAAMPTAERVWKVSQLNEKYGFTNNFAGKLDLNGEYSEAARVLYASWTETLQDKAPLDETTIIEASVDETPEEPVNIQNLLGPTEGEIFEISTDVVNDVGVIEYQPDDTSLKLNGDDYVTKTVNSMDDVSEFTLSAWVRPDYSQGSTQFTILSKANVFTLSISNTPFYEKTARFSIFDGIKWTSIESTSAVEQEWTHIAATLDSSKISIYVNGKLEGIKPIDGTTLNSFGFFEPETLETTSSDTQIIIGSEQISQRGQITYKGFFSGLVDEVIIQDVSLEDHQIVDICQQSEYYFV